MVVSLNYDVNVPLPYFIRGRFANYSTCKINLYIHKATFLSLVKTAALLLRLFNYFSVSMFISLPFLTSLTFFARSSISRSNCGRLSPSCN